MTLTSSPQPNTSDAAPSSVEAAEEAWLAALTAPDAEERFRSLMLPECLVVHGPVGHLDDLEAFLRNASGRSRAQRIDVHDVITRQFDDTAIVSCLQEMRVAYLPDRTPFVIQAAVTRVWLRRGEGWRLAHMQMARRFPPS
ncbi:nuclear transport factor 2 family protein [Streptomyces griseorubiginosus]|uniref:nuclear transport factor 2 family protein n=1 Tax=Streptomyces griseorubiginosus TaxID=67304 RepID=UPI001FCA9464|nr:nuclear transport factor 2 family protein [Streptomyces griseorubiginosus]